MELDQTHNKIRLVATYQILCAEVESACTCDISGQVRGVHVVHEFSNNGIDIGFKWPSSQAPGTWKQVSKMTLRHRAMIHGRYLSGLKPLTIIRLTSEAVQVAIAPNSGCKHCTVRKLGTGRILSVRYGMECYTRTCPVQNPSVLMTMILCEMLGNHLRSHDYAIRLTDSTSPWKNRNMWCNRLCRQQPVPVCLAARMQTRSRTGCRS